MDRKEAQLVKECGKGRRSAQLDLYMRYAPRLYATCLRIVGSKPDAEEAMHDAFLKIFDSFTRRVEFSSLEAWMQRIAIRTAIDALRRSRVAFEPLPPDVADVADEPGGVDEESVRLSVERVKAACLMLPAGYRVVLSLHLFEGYDFDEIASILNVRPPTVRTQYLRGRRRLMELISN